VQLTTEQCWQRLRASEHGVLCTSNAKGTIDAVPVCFAAMGEVIASPIDQVKAKTTTELGRIRNLERDPSATLLCERWDSHDWSQLWWVRVGLVRRSGHDVSIKLVDQCARALREKYSQYRDTEFAEVILFDVQRLTGWSAGEPAVAG
jgi:PPOX class probable F420-dependent enzyme